MQHDFILLDRSGSMESRWVEALSSINAYVAKLREEKVETAVTLAVFDHNIGQICFDLVRNQVPPRDWFNVSSSDCLPRGGTPLNDAIIRLVSMARTANAEKTAIIVMTDGQENSSREDRTGAIAKGMLDECRTKGWQVIFLGVDFDNARQASSYGNAARFTVSSAGGMHVNSMGKMGSKRADYAAGTATMDWSDEEKAEVAKKP